MAASSARRLAVALVAIVSLAVVSGCGRAPEARLADHLTRGDRFLAEGKLDEAIVEFRNAVAAVERSGEARLKLADALIAAGQLREGGGELVRAADLLPERADVQVRAGYVLVAARQYEDARARADKALALDEASTEARVLRATALAGMRDLGSALDELQEAAKLDAEEARIYGNIGALQAVQGNAAEAQAAFERAVEIAPASVEARLGLANFHWSVGNLAAAEATVREVLRLDAKSAVGNRALASLLVATGRAADAEPYYRTWAEAAPGPSSALALADYYLGVGRQDEAVRRLEALAGENDALTARLAQVKLAELDLVDGRPHEAARRLDALLTSAPADTRALVLKARLLLEAGRPADAKPLAERAVKSDPRSAPARYVLGQATMALGERDAAHEAFSESLRLNPRAFAARLQLSRLESMRGGRTAALEFAREAAQLRPTDPVARFLFANALVDAGETARAQAEVSLLLQAFPSAAPFLELEARLRAARGDRAGARRVFERALQYDPSSLVAVRGLVAIDSQEGRMKEAVARVEERLAAAPDDPRLLTLAAEARYAAGETARAEQHLQRAIAVDPASTRAFALLAQLYVNEGRLDDAVRELDALTARGGSRTTGPATLAAMVLQTQGRTDEARRRYEAVLAADPRAALAANNLAWIYAERGERLDEALQLVQSAKQLRPDDHEVNDTLGFVYLKRGLPALAVPPLRLAVEQAPDNRSYRYRLAEALVASGDRTAARAELNRALAGAADFPEAPEARALLAQLP